MELKTFVDVMLKTNDEKMKEIMEDNNIDSITVIEFNPDDCKYFETELEKEEVGKYSSDYEIYWLMTVSKDFADYLYIKYKEYIDCAKDFKEQYENIYTDFINVNNADTHFVGEVLKYRGRFNVQKIKINKETLYKFNIFPKQKEEYKNMKKEAQAYYNDKFMELRRMRQIIVASPITENESMFLQIEATNKFELEMALITEEEFFLNFKANTIKIIGNRSGSIILKCDTPSPNKETEIMAKNISELDMALHKFGLRLGNFIINNKRK